MLIISPLIRLILKIATIVFYLLTALCCFGGYISPNIFPLGSVAVLGMPIMLTISAILTVIWLCCRGWIVAATGVVMFIACATPIKMWFPMNSPSEADPADAPTLTLLTWNTLHGADLEDPKAKGSRMLSKILELKPDVVCLQEIFGFDKSSLQYFSQATLDSLLAIYPYQLGEGTYDLRILSRYPLRHIYFGSLHSVKLAECFTVKTPTREIAIANVHLPSFLLNENEKGLFSIHNANAKEKETLGLGILHKMEKVFPERADAAQRVLNGFDELAMPIIVCGDFNDVPASWVYRLFLKNGFQDAYVNTNFWPTYTFYPHKLYFHLDQIFYRGALRPLSVERLNIRTSDHMPLLAKFQILEGF